MRITAQLGECSSVVGRSVLLRHPSGEAAGVLSLLRASSGQDRPYEEWSLEVGTQIVEAIVLHHLVTSLPEDWPLQMRPLGPLRGRWRVSTWDPLRPDTPTHGAEGSTRIEALTRLVDHLRSLGHVV